MTRSSRPEGRPGGVGTHRNRTAGPAGIDVVRLEPGRLPDLERLADASIARLVAQSPKLLRCHHVKAIGGAVACASHPVAGLLCIACAEQHARRHAHELEHECDRCGQQAPTMHSVMARNDVVVSTITTARKPAIYAGPVVLVCLGVCEACAVELDLPVVVAS